MYTSNVFPRHIYTTLIKVNFKENSYPFPGFSTKLHPHVFTEKRNLISERERDLKKT